MMDLISVIVPFFNSENYLERCIKSISNQTYKNLEIILVNDGSSDNSIQICNRWKKKDARIKVIEKKNTGAADSRNIGISAATGEYIGFVDSDDYICIDMYELLYRAIKDSNSDIVICDLEKVNEIDGSIIEEYPINDEIIDRRTLFCRTEDPNGWKFVTVWNRLYRRSILQGVIFPTGKKYEDEFFMHRVFAKCQKATCISKKLYFYMIHSNSITTSMKDISRLDADEAFVERYYLMKKFGYKSMQRYLVNMTVCHFVYVYYRLKKENVAEYRDRMKEILHLVQIMYADYFTVWGNHKPPYVILWIHNIIYGIKMKLLG